MFKLTKQYHLIIYVISLYLLCIFACPVNAQENQQVSEACIELKLDKLDNFFVIDKLRVDLLNKIPLLKARKKEIEEIKLPGTIKIEKQLTEAQAKLKALEDQGSLTGDNLTQSNNLKDLISNLQDNLSGKTTQSFQQELTQLNDEISRSEKQLGCVNEKIDTFSETPEQGFKRFMSGTFAVLIGLVIAGFFIVAYTDVNVRRSIFGGQAGLQFVTLFSIVIAIILFGITNILEGRELAALLGGLSGYILGKYNAQGNETNRNGNNENQNAIIASINITPATIDLSTTNPTQQLTASATDFQNNPITLDNLNPQWSSDNTSVATVDQTGLVTRVATGNCNVTATVNGITSQNCSVTCS